MGINPLPRSRLKRLADDGAKGPVGISGLHCVTWCRRTGEEVSNRYRRIPAVHFAEHFSDERDRQPSRGHVLAIEHDSRPIRAGPRDHTSDLRVVGVVALAQCAVLADHDHFSGRDLAFLRELRRSSEWTLFPRVPALGRGSWFPAGRHSRSARPRQPCALAPRCSQVQGRRRSGAPSRGRIPGRRR
jgi:hypothetical protein